MEAACPGIVTRHGAKPGGRKIIAHGVSRVELVLEIHRAPERGERPASSPAVISFCTESHTVSSGQPSHFLLHPQTLAAPTPVSSTLSYAHESHAARC